MPATRKVRATTSGNQPYQRQPGRPKKTSINKTETGTTKHEVTQSKPVDASHHSVNQHKPCCQNCCALQPGSENSTDNVARTNGRLVFNTETSTANGADDPERPNNCTLSPSLALSLPDPQGGNTMVVYFHGDVKAVYLKEPSTLCRPSA
ncbi:hypothetical protein BDV24DRAFT_146367 [Aspergillus arachidicola]|uniref:Uncharacterized protein n=1 Tax=Aspergillus arachidicola TaxID=656916 RepID=A0A5N6XLG8_9EURO|nr:hypothetical protein BDV24DRAFT_146367 [Aspergillus arachidicola]